MESNVAIFDTHREAVEAVQTLVDGSFSSKNISLIGKGQMVDNHIHLPNHENVEKTTVLVGTTAGTIIGLLTGLSVFAIPGLGFLYGAGAVVGALAGFDFGVVGTGLFTLFTELGVNHHKHEEYKKHLEDGRYIVAIKGSEVEVKKAKEILHTKGLTINWD